MTPHEVIKDIYSEIDNKTFKELNSSKTIIENIDELISKIDKNKSLVSALVTSALKKILDPTQDIRLHRTDFKDGYSARSLDTSVTAPFFKRYFPKYANKESAFLTLATREKIKWTKKEGKNLKIRNSTVKNSFLELFDAIEQDKINPRDVLSYLFVKLKELQKNQSLIFDETITTAKLTHVVNINVVINLLEKHFACRQSSRIPVIAIYTIYQDLIKNIKRYHDKTLSKPNVHTSSDRHGFGDVEVWNSDGTPFEMIEIKHNIELNRNHIFDIIKKSEDTTIKRFYILTTSIKNFESEEEEKYIHSFILKIKKERGLDVIPNGIVSSLKYYLRVIDDYMTFIQSYTLNLIEDAKNSTEVQEYHISRWKEILEE